MRKKRWIDPSAVALNAKGLKIVEENGFGGLSGGVNLGCLLIFPFIPEALLSVTPR